MMILQKAVLAIWLFASICLNGQSGTGYQIKVNIDGYQGKEAYLGYHYGDKQYLSDTVQISQDGSFVFEGEEPLKGGVYLVVMPPDNQFFQLLINEDEQHFSVQFQFDKPAETARFANSPDNQLFYQYLQYLSSKRPQAEQLKKALTEAEAAKKPTRKIEKELEQLNEAVKNYQRDLVTKHSKTLTAAIVRASQELELPDFGGTEKDAQFQRWQWYKKHWFDHIAMDDPRMLRSPVLFQKIDHYINKLIVQHPDSINLAIDQVLALVRPSEETFKYYLIHFLNTYAQSKIVGMDAVYVHIVENYYSKGLAPWTEEEQLGKIVKNAKTLKPILIGKIAPNILMEKESKEKISLHQVNSDFTVLFFWDPECSHCKKSMPEMLEFYKKYKNKGVEVFAVCTKVTDGVPDCWKHIKEHNMIDWINVADPFLRSRYKQIYDIRSTPRIFVLDENKEILSKRIGAEQLPEVIDKLIEMKEKETENLGSKE